MFEKIGRMAERTATKIGRRQFLTRLGLGALGFATFVGVGLGRTPWCVYHGGCCDSPAAPYFSTRDQHCYADDHCRRPAGVCTLSNCCGGTNFNHSCVVGQCFQDDSCGTPINC